MTHHDDLSDPHQPVAQTEEAEDDSMLQTGPRKVTQNVIPPQDRSKTAAPQTPSQQEASANQGRVVFVFRDLYYGAFTSSVTIRPSVAVSFVQYPFVRSVLESGRGGRWSPCRQPLSQNTEPQGHSAFTLWESSSLPAGTKPLCPLSHLIPESG